MQLPREVFRSWFGCVDLFSQNFNAQLDLIAICSIPLYLFLDWAIRNGLRSSGSFVDTQVASQGALMRYA